MIQINRYWEDLNVLQVNREPARAYYIPIKTKGAQKPANAAVPRITSC